MHDLTQCLLLDGYIVEDTKLVQIDPSIADAAPLEDDLIVALQNSGAPCAQEIIAKIGGSAQAFRATPHDYNAALVNARVALESWRRTLPPTWPHARKFPRPTTRRNGAKSWRSCAPAAKSRPKRKRAWRVYSGF